MSPWSMLAYAGDAAVMIPAAVAIAAWLAISGAWRMALLWLLLFAAGCAIVALSKMAFMGWGTQIERIGYKALSGHAALTAAVMPVAGHLVSARLARVPRAIITGLGVAAGIGMGIFLVAFNHHTVSETIGGWMVGTCVGLVFIALHMRAPHPVQLRITPLACVLVFVVIWAAKPAMIKLWLEAAALHLSGRSTPYDWSE